MTLQEMFTTVATHLIRQNKQAKSELGRCEYKSYTGLRCAAGCLLDKYDLQRVGYGSVTHPDNVNIFTRIVGEDNLQPLRKLQAIHDAHPPDDWKFELTQFAIEHRLEIPVS